MENIPNLVQELNLRNTTNAVCISVVKYTIDQFDEFFTQENPAPAKLARQLVSCRARYSALDDVYAQQLKADETEEIAGLDKEGDQLVYGVKGLVDAFRRMDFDSEKKSAAGRYYTFMRKHRIEPTENMIAEWSKIQQFTAEWAASPSLQADAETLGLAGAMTRLAAIEVELRQLMTARNDAAPEAQAVKNAREALYPEYRALILLLNSFAVVDDDPQAFAQLINRLNKNIDYVRQHAMVHGSGSNNNSQNNQSGQSDQNNQTDNGEGSEQGGSEQGGSEQGGSEQGGSEQGGSEQGGSEQGGSEQGGGTDQGGDQGGSGGSGGGPNTDEDGD